MNEEEFSPKFEQVQKKTKELSPYFASNIKRI